MGPSGPTALKGKTISFRNHIFLYCDLRIFILLLVLLVNKYSNRVNSLVRTVHSVNYCYTSLNVLNSNPLNDNPLGKRSQWGQVGRLLLQISQPAIVLLEPPLRLSDRR